MRARARARAHSLSRSGCGWMRACGLARPLLSPRLLPLSSVDAPTTCLAWWRKTRTTHNAGFGSCQSPPSSMGHPTLSAGGLRRWSASVQRWAA